MTVIWFGVGCVTGYTVGWVLSYAASVIESIEDGANDDREWDED